jgi:hypothetical protein
MTKITQKQLIGQLQQLKEIKPRKEWALLLKSQITADLSAQAEMVSMPEKKISFINGISSVFSQRKLAYAFTAALLLIGGVFGFTTLFSFENMPQQPAALSSQASLKSNVATLNNKINDLAQVAKTGKKTSISSVETEINTLTKNLKNNPISDPVIVKELAVSLKTLADVPGVDLTENKDVKDLYQTVVENQIFDLEKTTLTTEQKEILKTAKDLYEKGKYADALEAILMINN